LRETPVAQRRGVRPVLDHELVTDTVELVGRDSRCDRRFDGVQRLCREQARLAHSLDRVGVLHVGALVRLGCELADVLGALDRGGDVAHWRYCVWSDGSHFAEFRLSLMAERNWSGTYTYFAGTV